MITRLQKIKALLTKLSVSDHSEPMAIMPIKNCPYTPDSLKNASNACGISKAMASHIIHCLKKRVKRLNRAVRRRLKFASINQYLSEISDTPIFLEPIEHIILGGFVIRRISETICNSDYCRGCSNCGTLKLRCNPNDKLLSHIAKFHKIHVRLCKYIKSQIDFPETNNDISKLVNYCTTMNSKIYISCTKFIKCYYNYSTTASFNNLLIDSHTRALIKLNGLLSSMTSEKMRIEAMAPFENMRFDPYFQYFMHSLITNNAIIILKYMLLLSRCMATFGYMCSVCKYNYKHLVCIYNIKCYIYSIVAWNLEDIYPLFDVPDFLSSSNSSYLLHNFIKKNAMPIVKLFCKYVNLKDDKFRYIYSALEGGYNSMYEYVIEQTGDLSVSEIDTTCSYVLYSEYESMNVLENLCFNGTKAMLDMYFRMIRPFYEQLAGPYKISLLLQKFIVNSAWTYNIIDNLILIISYMSGGGTPVMCNMRNSQIATMINNPHKAFEFIDLLVKKKLVQLDYTPKGYREYIAKPWPANRPTPPSVMTFLLSYQRQANAGILPFMDPNMMREMLANIPYSELV